MAEQTVTVALTPGQQEEVARALVSLERRCRTINPTAYEQAQAEVGKVASLLGIWPQVVQARG